MKDTLIPGLEHTFSFWSRRKDRAYVYPESDLFREMPEVFATAFMVGFMSGPAWRPCRPPWKRASAPWDDDQHHPPGRHPPGMTVTAV